MPKDFPRALRVGEQIRRELATLIRYTIKDPRVKNISISEVVVSADLSSAKVFYIPFADISDIANLQAGLQSSAPFLRKELGKLLHIRAVPQLNFIYDDSEERSARLEQLIAQQSPSSKEQ